MFYFFYFKLSFSITDQVPIRHIPNFIYFQLSFSIRSPFANVVEDKCPAKQKLIKRKLLGSDFQSNNEDHLKLVKDMGITIIALSDGRVQLLHTFANVRHFF
jgi:hypothetical protein